MASRWPFGAKREQLSGQALARIKARFEAQHDENDAPLLTFSQLAWTLFSLAGWDCKQFKHMTLLSDAAFCRIKNDVDWNWSFLSVVSICVGLRADISTAELLLKAAGFSFGTSRKRKIYSFLFTDPDLIGRGIIDCNAFLLAMEAPLLGGAA